MKINRRQFVRNLGLGTASLSMGSLISTSSCAPSGDSRDKRGKVSDDDQFLLSVTISPSPRQSMGRCRDIC